MTKRRRGAISLMLILPAGSVALLVAVAAVAQNMTVVPLNLITALAGFSITIATVVTSHMRLGHRLDLMAKDQQGMRHEQEAIAEKLTVVEERVTDARYQTGINGHGGLKGELHELSGRLTRIDAVEGTEKGRHRMRNVVTAISLAAATNNFPALKDLQWRDVDKTE